MTPPKAKQGLPEWVENGDWTDPRHCERVEEALSIAWEFMKTQVLIADVQRTGMHPIRYAVGSAALETMRLIEELK